MTDKKVETCRECLHNATCRYLWEPKFEGTDTVWMVKDEYNLSDLDSECNCGHWTSGGNPRDINYGMGREGEELN